MSARESRMQDVRCTANFYRSAVDGLRAVGADLSWVVVNVLVHGKSLEESYSLNGSKAGAGTPCPGGGMEYWGGSSGGVRLTFPGGRLVELYLTTYVGKLKHWVNAYC